MGSEDRGAVRGTGSRRFRWRSADAVLVIVLAFAVVGLTSDSSRSAPVPSAFLTITDQNGANDVPGQQDLTQMGRDDSDPNVYRILLELGRHRELDGGRPG